MEEQLQIVPVIAQDLAEQQQIAPVAPQARDASVSPGEGFLPIRDMRLAVALRVFRATLGRCPLEWVDIHKSRESFLRNLESKRRGDRPEQDQPEPQVTWNFGTYPTTPRLLGAFYKPMEETDAELEMALSMVEPTLRVQLKDAIARLIMRVCHEALIQREWLAAFARSVPENAKFDQIIHGRRIVRMGKRSSPELRQHYLSKLPAK